MNSDPFVHTLLEWYPHNKRDLPWRSTNNPYIIWLSEIILQQTRVAQGLPYFEKFLENFPHLEDLANASEETVMRLWQGLGYYSRARNLHFCAKFIRDHHDGIFPDNYQALIQLKGVGTYTAAAIASFAFDEAVAVVDGNVFRALARYFGIATDIAGNMGKKEFEALANTLIPKDRPAEFNQAIMEFGALQCVPKNPDCANCPMRLGCVAFKNDLVDSLPVKIKKLKIKERYFRYSYIVCDGEVVVKRRGEGDIWQGLHDFPMQELSEASETSDERVYIEESKDFKTNTVMESEKWYKHILTHQRIFANFTTLIVPKENRNNLQEWTNSNGFQLVSSEKLDELGKPRLIVKFLEDQK
ncbi:A/G-specific adenine glycosylase [Aquiflexum sp. TKW24L]|uniref:A/G-specific adenine glycosylase n=1 Tax=Aquiflexum sp. TKW24L TaxID=2942212 RepID=UPI0020BF18D2|nr:A/G-specific adenine glycosylase [Aquiflexum sp. TKW24L]MCL6260057.1 A/G-specific adenine glycosylase [Aquiflexum sp. TKW24L]